VSVYTSGSIVSSGEDAALFSWYSMRSMVVIQYSMPCGRNVSLWVGGWDVKADFVPKIDHCRVGTHCPLGWQRTLVFEDHLGVHLVRAEIILVRWFALHSFWGSAWSFHVCFVILLAPRLGLWNLHNLSRLLWETSLRDFSESSLWDFSESRGYGFSFHYLGSN